MANNALNYRDELNEVNKALEQTISLFEQGAKAAIELNGVFKEGVQSYTKVQKAVKQTNTNTEELTATEKELQKIIQQTEKARAQAEALQTKEGQELITQQEKRKKVTRELREEAKKQLGITKQSIGFTQKLGNTFKAAFAEVLVIIGILKGVYDALKRYVQLTEEVSKQNSKVAATFSATQSEARAYTLEIRKLSTAFDKDFNDVLKSANILSKEFGISTDEALGLIRQGFEKGADVNGEFLELLKEYPAQLKTVGLNAEETIAIITQTEREGVFSDKGIDAIKEAGIRLRELTPATRDALDAIGLSSAEIEKSLADGSNSLFQVTQDVSARLAELPPQSAKVGTAIADIFGGAGEDAGIRFLSTLKDIDLELAGIDSSLSENERATIAVREAWEELRTTSVGSGSFIARIKLALADVIISVIDFRNNFVEGFNDLVRSSGIFRAAIVTLTEAVKLNFKIMFKAFKIAFIDPFIGSIDIIKKAFTLGLRELSIADLRNSFAVLTNDAKDIGVAFVDSGKKIAAAYRGDDIEKFLLGAKEVQTTVRETNDIFENAPKITAKATEQQLTELDRLSRKYAETNLKILEDEKTTQSEKAELLKKTAFDQLADQIAINEQLLEEFKGTEEAKFDIEQELLEEKIRLNEQFNEFLDNKRQEQIAAEDERRARELAAERAQAQALIGLGNEVFNFTNTLGNRELADLQNRRDQGLITEQQYARDTAIIQRRQAILSKAQAALNISLNTAQGITAALASVPPNVPLSVLIGTTGAIQLAAALAEPIPQVPSFKKGVTNFSGGMAEFAEAGRELLDIPGHGIRLVEQPTIGYLPPGTDVHPNWETEKYLAEAGGSTPESFDKFVEEQKKTRKAIQGIAVHSTQINGSRWSESVAKGSSRIKFIDKYFRG